MSVDPIKPIRILMFVMKFLGLWTYREPSFNRLYTCYKWLLHSAFTFLFIFAQIINVYYTESVDDFADALYMTLTEMVLFVKLLNFFSISEKVVDFLEILEYDTESQPNNDIELKTVREHQGSFITLHNVFITGCFSILVASDVAALLDDNYKLPFPCWFPFNYRNSDNYMYAFFYVAIAMIITSWTNMSMDLLQAYFMCHLASFYRLIALRLENYGRPEDAEEWKRIMRLHKFAETMAVKCQNIISVPVFAQIVLSAFILGFTAYKLQKVSLLTDTVDFITLLMFAVEMALQIYLPCFFGNEVTLSADALTWAAYNSNWVELSAQSKKDIFIYMEYLKRPVNMKAGQFFYIGLGVFSKVINNAYSLFALLLNMKD